MSAHLLKVAPEYWDALVSGAKRFEVRRNDRAFQAGDIVALREWHGAKVDDCTLCKWSIGAGHWAADVVLQFMITFVYSGDPRFGGVEPGHVVLGLGDPPPTGDEAELSS